MLKEFTCIMCPQGCSLKVELAEGQEPRAWGFSCPKGQEYAVQEALAPKRGIATSVYVEGGELPLASVRLSAPIPKEDIFKAMEEIRRVRLKAPVYMGQVVISGILGTEADVIATKDVKRIAAGREEG